MRLDLGAVHHEIGIGIAEPLLGNDHPCGMQGGDQIRRHRGRPLFVRQGDVFVRDDAADEVPLFPVSPEEFEDDGVVLVVVRGVLVARRHAIPGDDGSEEHLRRDDHPGEHLLGVQPAIIRIMEQSLGLEHIEVGDPGKFPRIGGRPDLMGTRGIRIDQGILAVPGKLRVQRLPGEEIGGFQTGQPDGFLVIVAGYPLPNGDVQHQVMLPGKQGVFGPRPGHVDQPFLKAYDRSHRGDDHPAQRRDRAGRYPRLIRIPPIKHAGENLVFRNQAQAGLDDVLDRDDPYRFPGTGDIDFYIFYVEIRF